MPAILSHVWEFIIAVGRRWGVLVTGGFIVGLISVYEHWSGRPIAGRLFWSVIVISLLAAFFSAWRQERLTFEGFKSRREVCDYLSRSLIVIDKFTRVINDPHQEVPIERINEWEAETVAYLRKNVSEAAANLFTSEIGAPLAPPYRFIEERSAPLRRLHYRSHQLLKILDQLGVS
jgi:hypothetical protein